MGVSTLAGIADGTTPAAAMYDRGTGQMIGPIFEADDAAEQIEAFLQWLYEGKWRSDLDAILAPGQRGGAVWLPGGGDGTDARHWTDVALQRLVSFWRVGAVDEHGELLDVYECSCGPGHHHMGEVGETARHGPCFDPACPCTTWTPGNQAARAAAEGE